MRVYCSLKGPVHLSCYQSPQTSVHPTQKTLTELQETQTASQDSIEFSGEMISPGLAKSAKTTLARCPRARHHTLLFYEGN